MDFVAIYKKVEHVYIYTRVSTKKQVGETNVFNTGIEAQKQICLDYYNEKFRPNLNIEPEIISETGSSFNNEDILVNLDKLIETIPKKSMILIAEISRLGRNIYQVIERVYKPVEIQESYIISVNDQKVFGYERGDDLYFFTQTIQAESFSIIKSVDTKKRNRLMVNMGGYVGGIPFGKKTRKLDNGVRVLVSKPTEEALIRRIIGYHNKNYTVPRIYELLSNNPRNKYRGKCISKSLIRSILKRYAIELDNAADSFVELNI